MERGREGGREGWREDLREGGRERWKGRGGEEGQETREVHKTCTEYQQHQHSCFKRYWVVPEQNGRV